ncbi:chaperonin 10-like protein [Boeremia exigua]|uniref:chaperonin 10-like protein n=1 Tax=Boeremia exigua TaxID=749465 RepID=UPI001E8CAFD2|nr:chaperonin 10-like protein [Boeremia exigua]KAH6643191.1 chaperonin 10-like protein [Boeremia exigua]
MQNPSIVLYAPRTASLEDRPLPAAPGPHDVVVRIAFVGVCGSDVHFWRHGGISHPLPPSGLVMGHEASGTVSSVGAAVTRVSVGDAVAVEPGVPCRRCKMCVRGEYQLCGGMRFAAAPGAPGKTRKIEGRTPDTHGALAKYFVVPEELVYRLDGVGLQEGVLVEPAAVAVHAVRLGRVEAGETVVIMGSGTVGLLCAAVARQFGAHRVLLVDILERKLEFARGWLGVETFCADTTTAPEEDAERMLAQFGLSEGDIDTVIEASGAASSVNMGVRLVRPGGKYVQVGVGQAKIEFPIVAVSNKELLFRGCFRYGPGDFELALKFIAKGLIQVKPLISSVTPFEDATEAWEKTARGEGIKNLIEGVKD